MAFSPAELFQQIHPLSQAASEFLEASWDSSFTIKRGDFLVQTGEISRYLYYVEEGAFRIYYPTADAEPCLGFGYSNTFLVDLLSLVRRKPSKYAIQALRKSKVIGISRELWEEGLERFPDLFKAWFLANQSALLGMIDREAELLTFTPEQRLSRLMDRSPHLFQEIPQKYIASYLRMSPETLSRLMSKS